MITQYAKSNDKLYDALFEDISSSVPGVSITTLEGYFLNLQKIAEYVIEGVEDENGDQVPNLDKTYFLRLPVDENMVTINANTRTINLSNAYRSNGIAVVGDTYAETLWFQIDRYYDLQDLSALNIYIYWELPNKVKGYSIPVFKDIHSEAGKLIFSWTIPAVLTEMAGNIKFYVSFQDDSNSGSYIFNTLPQTAKINATLDIDVSEGLQGDGVNAAQILNRLQSTTDIGAVVVNRPLISDCTSDGEVDLLVAGQNQYIDVYAYSIDNSAVLEYQLYKDGNPVTVTPTTCYAQTNDTVANLDKTYYNNDDGTGEACEFYAGCYEKGARFTVSEVGSYQCKVIATITVVEGTTSHKSMPAYTTRWLWEKPTEFTVSNDAVKFKNNANHILQGTDDGEAGRTLVITWPINTKESPQQQAATYKADVRFGDSSTIVNTFTRTNSDTEQDCIISYPFTTNEVGTKAMRIRFTKTLNNVVEPASSADIEMQVQTKAKPYEDVINVSVSGTTVDENGVRLIRSGSMFAVTFPSTNMYANQEYSYCWQIKNGTKWEDVINPKAFSKPEDEATSVTISNNSLATNGEYRLKVIAKFRADSAITYSSATAALIKVYTI